MISMSVINEISVINDSGKQGVKRKRVGKNGAGWEKSLDYITDGRKRRAKEKVKLEQLENLINQVSMLTKTPIAVFALTSQSEIWLAGTTSKMMEFVRNDDVQKQFEIAAKGDSEPFLNFQSKRSVQNKFAGVENEAEDFEIPVYWEKMNTLKKRDLVRNLVRWYTEAWQPWIPSLKPEWWPNDIQYRSTRKSDVASLDKILKSFFEFRAKSSMASFKASDLPTGEQWADSKWNEESLCPKYWLERHWSPPKTTFDTRLVSIKYRCLVAGTDLEPFHFDTTGECISFALFATPQFSPFMKLATILGCLSNLDVMLEWIKNGFGDMNYEVVQTLFGATNKKELEEQIIQKTIDSSIFELVGVFLAFGISVSISTEAGLFVFGDTERKIHLLFNDQTTEYCCLLKGVSFEKTCRQHNHYCNAVLTATQTFQCQSCLLEYHIFCAADDRDCGCSSESQVIQMIKEHILQGDDKHIESMLLFKRDRQLESYILQILKGIYPACRTKIVTKLVNDRDAEENRFFMKTMSSSKYWWIW
ncbi:uncharacterized protein [Clytia hemisphaerica]|uniref:uncharacterized protein isoform X2 n=1 Tax=Clytia hemisphaerica TaxID=252671 RepID=UPI0034D59A4A